MHPPRSFRVFGLSEPYLLGWFTVFSGSRAGLASYWAAIRELPAFQRVDHQQVIKAARCNNLVEQSHRLTRQQERSQLGFRNSKRT